MLPAWLGTLVPNPLQHLHWLRKKQKLKAEGGKGGSGGGAGEGVKRVEKEEMWEFVSGELSGTLQGRREILEDARFRHKLERAPKDGTEGSLGPW